MGLLWIVLLQVEYAPLKAKREECSKQEQYILVNSTEKMKNKIKMDVVDFFIGKP